MKNLPFFPLKTALLPDTSRVQRIVITIVDAKILVLAQQLRKHVRNPHYQIRHVFIPSPRPPRGRYRCNLRISGCRGRGYITRHRLRGIAPQGFGCSARFALPTFSFQCLPVFAVQATSTALPRRKHYQTPNRRLSTSTREQTASSYIPNQLAHIAPSFLRSIVPSVGRTRS